MNERDLAVSMIKKLGYPNLATLVKHHKLYGYEVADGIKQLYWVEHTADERKLITELIHHCRFFDI